MGAAEEKYYNEKCKPYKVMTANILQKEAEFLAAARKDPDHAADKLFTLADEMLNLMSYYLSLNCISMVILKKINENDLNEARKALYKAVIYLENIVTNKVDAPYSDYETETKELCNVIDAGRRLAMVRKTGLSIALLQSAYGSKSKWKWAFVEVEGRFAAVSKNMIDLSTVVTDTEPSSPVYEPVKRHVGIVKRLLSDAADHYRDRYSLTSQNLSDLIVSLNFLNSLKFLHSVLGEQEEAREAKQRLDVVKAKITMEKEKEAQSVRVK